LLTTQAKDVIKQYGQSHLHNYATTVIAQIKECL